MCVGDRYAHKQTDLRKDTVKYVGLENWLIKNKVKTQLSRNSFEAVADLDKTYENQNNNKQLFLNICRDIAAIHKILLNFYTSQNH